MQGPKRTAPSAMPVQISGAISKSSTEKPSIISSSYISYQIRAKDDQVTARRYTEFEGLQAHLYRSYPRSIIPPIPLKENLTDYFAKYFTSKSTEASQRLIQQRIRALQVFLDYIEGHPVLSKDEVFQKFISTDPNWTTSEPRRTPSPHTTSSGSTNNVFSDCSRKVFLLQHTLENLEKSQTKLLRGMRDAVKGYGELGSALNAFSLESQTASKELDACGVLFDAIGGDGHEMIQNQLILGESIQLCQQFCGAIQRAIDNNSDLQEDQSAEFKKEITNAIKVIEDLMHSTISASMKSHSSYYSNASEKFAEYKLSPS